VTTRLRDIGIGIGSLPPGQANAISDVDGVSVGHCTVVADTPRVLRTGVTVVHSRPRESRDDLCYGGSFAFNGNGEMTGTHWLAESGLMLGPIAITNTHQVGLTRDELVRHVIARRPETEWCLPIVGETYDGHLNDIAAFGLEPEHVRRALSDADEPGPVAEGNVGGGTGMICHGFKGGIGTASRQVPVGAESFTVGALVQANYGERRDLRLDGRPVGERIDGDAVPLPDDPATAGAGSIIVIVATDAPLIADQCQRLAKRATIGLARVGGAGANGSGDLFLAFSTHNRVSPKGQGLVAVESLGAEMLTPLFDGVAEAVEESIWNALVAAETMTGFEDRVVYAIPVDRLRELVHESG
jgi:D-aminopeptidase